MSNTRESYEDLVRKMDEAWQAEDPATAVASHFSESGEFQDMTAPEIVRGPAAIAEALSAYTSAFRPLTFESTLVCLEGKTAVVEWIGRGEHTGPLGNVPATGERIEVSGINLLRFDDAGLLVSERSYFDAATMLAQLGLLPE